MGSIGSFIAQRVARGVRHWRGEADGFFKFRTCGICLEMGLTRKVEAVEQYYVDIDGQTAGPFSAEELGGLLTAGRITRETLFAKHGAVEWMPVSLIAPILHQSKPPVMPPPVPVDTRVKARYGDWVCTRCGHVGSTGTETPGNLLIEIILWLFFLIPGLIYSIWRISKRHHVCRSCGTGAGLIPASSPNAGAWVVQDAVSTEPNWTVAVLVTGLLAAIVIFAVYGEALGIVIVGSALFLSGLGWLGFRWMKERHRASKVEA